jgi:serine phosphatase RsbU (regulator of sigma subunit)/CHASE2 domain-containing sensor protein
MTALERKVFKWSAIVASSVTLLVLVLDAAGALAGLEKWLYDRRMADCQFFRKPPTTQIVHIDIDDRSLEAIHKWPWPRDTIAAILDEIGKAGAKVVATDIIFSEPAEVVGRTQRDGSMSIVDEDKVLADTFSRMGNIVLPASLLLAPRRAVTEIDAALRAEITANLEITPEQLETRLRQRGFDAEEVRWKVSEQFLPTRRLAMADRIRQEISRGPSTLDELYARLIPNTNVKINPPLKRVLDEQHANVQAWLALSRFALPAQKNIAPPLATDPNAIPIPAFSNAARACGFADDSLTEPVVRSMPMFVECQGRIFGQWGLEFACVLAGADISKAVITDSGVTIPSPEGDYYIPLRSQYSGGAGRKVPYMADIPWWGTDDWRTMYDWPKYREKSAHLPITVVWDICQTKERIRTNNTTIDKAVVDLLDAPSTVFHLGMDPTLAQKYRSALPPLDDPTAREAIVAQVEKICKDFPNIAEAYIKIPEEERKPEDIAAYHIYTEAPKAMRSALEQNRPLRDQLQQQETQLTQLISGKGVLIGSTATGAMDMVTTPLHPRCPGVVVHGAIANAFLTRQWWRTAPLWVTYLMTVLLGLSIALATSWLSPWSGVFTAIMTLVGYFALNGVLLFDWGHWIVGAAGPMVAIALAWSAAIVTRLVIEGRERARVERQRAFFAHEMGLAKNVQQALLPKDMPSLPGIEPFGWTKAADETGGDLFDLWTLPDGRLGILVADASGHGLAPSVIVSQVRTLVRALSEIEKHPNGLLARVNARLAQDLEPARFVTAFLGFMTNDGQLDWASAGHGPMLWCAKEDEEFQQLDATALPLGIMPDYMGDEIPPLQLDVGGMFIVTSDGIFEAPAANGDQFGIERVIETLKVHGKKPCSEIIDAIRDAVTKWQRDPDKPADDQTTVIIRRVDAGLHVTMVEKEAVAAGS